MNTVGIIELAVSSNVGLFVKDGQLGVRADKGALSDELKSLIKQHKDEIIAYLSGMAPAVKLPPIKALGSDKAPLSYAQQRLWFVDKLNGGGKQYNMAAALSFSGKLDVEACNRAFSIIIQRHSILRTNYVEEDGEVFQCIRNEFEFRIAEYDLSALDDYAKQEQVNKLSVDNANRDFDLEKDLMFRASIIHTEVNAGFLFLCMHHIASDGQSLGIFIQEFTSLYRSCIENQDCKLAELEIQYSDYAQWERKVFAEDLIGTKIDYWRNKLADIAPIHSLHLDYVRPASQSQVGEKIERNISRDITDEIEKFCAKQNITMFMFLQSLLTILIYRYTDDPDVVVGTPASGRQMKETSSLIGFFLNNLVIRNIVSDEMTVEETLKLCKKNIVEAFDNQEVPFDVLVEKLNVERDLSYNPVFQIKINLNNGRSGNYELPGIKLAPFENDSEVSTTGLDLALDIFESEKGLRFIWAYDNSLFENKTVTSIAESYCRLIPLILRNPAAILDSLAIVDEKDESSLMDSWNASSSKYDEQSCIHELFESFALSSPDAIAVVEDGYTVSYAELNQQSNRLAHYLIQSGVKSEQRIAICVERSVDMMVGIFASLKLGACYIPIDPSYPDDRIEYILTNANAGVVLTQNEVMPAHFLDERISVLLDDDMYLKTMAVFSDQNIAKTDRALSAQNTAYGIYTSGSTGVPKGVALAHQGMVNLSGFFTDSIGLSPEDRVLQFASLGFDASVWEWVMALSTGASLYIAPDAVKMSGHRFGEFIRRHQLTCATLPPAYINTLELDKLGSLRNIFFAGEALDVKRAAEVTQALPDCTVFNAYGPTESTVCASVYPINTLKNQVVPIGKPISNMHCYVMGRNNQMMPIGAVGELRIGGPGLAQEYINLPELTNEKFFLHSFENGHKERLYKTGDLVRWNYNGELEFVGRVDTQVKLRGFRIELEEVESCLLANEWVESAVAKICVNEKSGQNHLVLYVVPQVDEATMGQMLSEPSIERKTFVETCRDYLKTRLPSYMVPDFFVLLAKLPMNENGKIHLKSLPVPDFTSQQTMEFVDSRNNIEADLVEIWKDVLGLERVGVYDDFFALGGDSIISIQIISRLKRKGIALTVRDIFNNKTISEISKVINTCESKVFSQEPDTGQAKLLPIQLAFLAENLREYHHYNQSMLLRAPANLHRDTLGQMAKSLIKKHDVLRLKFEKDDANWISEFIPQEDIAEDRIIDIHDLSPWSRRDREAEVRKIGEDVQRSLNIHEGKLFRLVYIKHSGDEARLMVVVHHMVMDGVSWRVIINDIESIYQQCRVGVSNIKLTPKTTSFKAWGEALYSYAETLAGSEEKQFWCEQLSKSVSKLPVTNGDSLAVCKQSDMVATALELSPAATKKLLTECNEAFNTQTNELIISALVLAIAEWARSQNVKLLLEGHGRESSIADVDLSETLGWFTSVYPLVIGTDNNASIAKNILDIKEQYRGVPVKGLGFGVYKYLLQDQKILELEAQQKGSEVLFNYLGNFDTNVTDESLFTVANEAHGSPRSDGIREVAPLNIDAVVHDGTLRCTIKYSQSHYHNSAIEQFTRIYQRCLDDVIQSCEFANKEKKNRTMLDQLKMADLEQSEEDNTSFEI